MRYPKMILGLGFCLVFVFSVWAEQEKWDDLNGKVIKLCRESRYIEATEIAEKSVAVAERTFGSDHLNVAMALNSLAELYKLQGRYAEAEFLYKRSIAIYEKMVGPDHPLVAIILINLTQLNKQMGIKKEDSECDECPQRIEPQKADR